MKTIKTAKYIKQSQAGELYLFDKIAKFVTNMSREEEMTEALQSIQKNNFEIYQLEKKIISKAMVQRGVSRGQDYYGKDYISQHLTGTKLGEIQDVLTKMYDGSIEDVANSVAAYKQRLQNLLKELTGV